LEPRFEITHLNGTFLIERNILLDGAIASPGSGSPLWHLSRSGVGIVSLPEHSSDTPEMVTTRFLVWLKEHYFEFSHLGVAYQLYRIPGDSWRLVKEFPEPAGAWEVRREDEYISRFPESEASDYKAAVAAFSREMAEQAALVECFGGPLDGQRLSERGDSFQVMEESGRSVDRGHYRRTKRGYDWEVI